VVSERLRVLNEQRRTGSADPYAPATLSTSVNRQTLREVLAAGLDGRLVFGCELAGYEDGQDGVRLRFADGRQAEADLLVGADGVGSAVRRQYLPAAAPADTGKRCVYGKTPLGPAEEDALPSALRDGFTAVIGGQIGMATGLVRFRQRPERAASWLSPAGDYLMWAVAGDGGRFGITDERLTAMAPADLHALTAKLIKSWHPDLRALHARAAVDETFLVKIRTSPPVPPWPPSRVTVLGDAIHAMSPARGSGANTALQDAALLSGLLTGGLLTGGLLTGRTLTGAEDEGAERAGITPDLIAAVGAYERQMRDYGYAAVAASSAAEAETGARYNRIMFWLYRRMTGPRALLAADGLHRRADLLHLAGQGVGVHRRRDDLAEAVVVEEGAHGHAVRPDPVLDARRLAAQRARADHLGPVELLGEAVDRGGRVGVRQVAADEHDDLRGVAGRGVARLVDRRLHVAGLARAHGDDLLLQRVDVGLVLQVHGPREGTDLVRGAHDVHGAAVRRELELDDADDGGRGHHDHAAQAQPEAVIVAAAATTADPLPSRGHFGVRALELGFPVAEQAGVFLVRVVAPEVLVGVRVVVGRGLDRPG
jgi:hypothetical protein